MSSRASTSSSTSGSGASRTVRYHQVRDGFDLGQGVLGRRCERSGPQFVRDVRDDPDFIPAVPGLVSEVALPLVGETSAASSTSRPRAARFPEDSGAISARWRGR